MIKLLAKPVIASRRAALLTKVNELKLNMGRAPHLVVVLIGSDPASEVYVGKKGEAAEAVGFTHETILFPHDVAPAVVRAKIETLNQDKSTDGILIQRPLPKQFSEKEAIFWVAPEKDVDCLHPENVGLLVSGDARFFSCTPGGIMILLEHYGISVDKKIACVIGRSAIVGKPLASLLLGKNASIIQIHRSTPNPEALCSQADLVFVAAGVQGLVKKEWIKKGAVVIDVGVHRNEHNKLSGDVDVESLGDLPSALSPVPGGVGPMTIQVLLENTFASAKKRSTKI
jgi:methylenetetrahydrofolate dehydrogenase (NADP+)/methenyltetrahydrofolate cyclohydrolase